MPMTPFIGWRISWRCFPGMALGPARRLRRSFARRQLLPGPLALLSLRGRNGHACHRRPADDRVARHLERCSSPYSLNWNPSVMRSPRQRTGVPRRSPHKISRATAERSSGLSPAGRAPRTPFYAGRGRRVERESAASRPPTIESVVFSSRPSGRPPTAAATSRRAAQQHLASGGSPRRRGEVAWSFGRALLVVEDSTNPPAPPGASTGMAIPPPGHFSAADFRVNTEASGLRSQIAGATRSSAWHPLAVCEHLVGVLRRRNSATALRSDRFRPVQPPAGPVSHAARPGHPVASHHPRSLDVIAPFTSSASATSAARLRTVAAPRALRTVASTPGVASLQRLPAVGGWRRISYPRAARWGSGTVPRNGRHPAGVLHPPQLLPAHPEADCGHDPPRRQCRRRRLRRVRSRGQSRRRPGRRATRRRGNRLPAARR